VPQFPTESPTEITDGIVLSVLHRELEKNYGPVPQLPTASPTDVTDGHYRRNISVVISQRVGKQLWACATMTNGITDGITVEFYKRNIPSVTWWREIFLLARLSVCMSVGIFFFTDRNGDEIRITDAHDSNGFFSSEIPSVIILPTVCVPNTDGSNPSVKLYNGVVKYVIWWLVLLGFEIKTVARC
jgi:hypothetical protein